MLPAEGVPRARRSTFLRWTGSAEENFVQNATSNRADCTMACNEDRRGLRAPCIYCKLRAV